MPLQKLQMLPGINRDQTSLSAEGSWYACDKVRFRSGFPEKIGGWTRISANTYLGICRSLSVWRTLASAIYTGVGTSEKMYVEYSGDYNDITPIRATAVIAANAFTTATGLSTVVVNDTAHGAVTGAYVVISASGADVGGVLAAQFEGEFEVTYLTDDTYQITVPATASGVATGGNATFNYLVNPGDDIVTYLSGWGAGGYGTGTWGAGSSTGTVSLRVWNQLAYGETLLFGPRGGALYQFTPNSTPSVFARGVLVSSLPGASDVPLFQLQLLMEQAERIVIAFGANPTGTSVADPLLVRWSDSDSVVEWTPAITNTAGEYSLPTGSTFVAAAHARNEIIVLTDAACYTMQYVGAPRVFDFAQQSNNISIIGPLAVTAANGIVYWMGNEKFYVFDGKVQTLPCPLLDEVFDDINALQLTQTFAGTNEGFDEVWWQYCSEDANLPDRYVIYNYASRVWYYGTLTRTAWLDAPLKGGPLAATTVNNLVLHENGVDSVEGGSNVAIEAYVESADFDIGDGHNYGFVRKILPDLTFTGSSAFAPAVTMTVRTRNDPGSAHNTETNNTVTRTSVVEVQQWTPEVFMRARGRQMSLRVASDGVGVQWKVGVPRIDVRPDGRRA